MDFLEKDLEDIIWNAQSTREGREKLKSRGLNIQGKVFRQPNLGEYGIPDLVSIVYKNKAAIITIYELKRDEVNVHTLFQSSKYVKGIRILLERFNLNWSSIHVCLIGKRIDINTDFSFLIDMIPHVHVYTYNIEIDGLHFKKKYDFRFSNHEIFDKITPVFKYSEIKEMRNGTDTDD